MSLQERLEILTEELNSQIKYRNKIGLIGSTIDYSSADFERESMLQRKIIETKEWIKQEQK